MGYLPYPILENVYLPDPILENIPVTLVQSMIPVIDFIPVLFLVRSVNSRGPGPPLHRHLIAPLAIHHLLLLSILEVNYLYYLQI